MDENIQLYVEDITPKVIEHPFNFYYLRYSYSLNRLTCYTVDGKLMSCRNHFAPRLGKQFKNWEYIKSFTIPKYPSLYSTTNKPLRPSPLYHLELITEDSVFRYYNEKYEIVENKVIGDFILHDLIYYHREFKVKTYVVDQNMDIESFVKDYLSLFREKVIINKNKYSVIIHTPNYIDTTCLKSPKANDLLFDYLIQEVKKQNLRNILFKVTKARTEADYLKDRFFTAYGESEFVGIRRKSFVI